MKMFGWDRDFHYSIHVGMKKFDKCYLCTCMEFYKMVEQDLVPCLLEFLSVRRTYRFSNLTSTIFDTTINTKCTYVRNLKPWILTVPCRGALGLPICRNGGPWGCTPGPSPQIVAGQLTLYEPGRADSAHHITTWPTQILRPTTIHEFI